MDHVEDLKLYVKKRQKSDEDCRGLVDERDWRLMESSRHALRLRLLRQCPPSPT